MLIRVSGGSSGICEYLEDGVKSGREHTRDELDHRLVLDGDMDILKATINNIDRAEGAQKYLHVTLAFKEDFIDEARLADIANDFKNFALAAYEVDEYQFYAEAHLPKIKSLTDQRTNENIERKPHIHIVIPETNLKTGKRLDPFGLVDNNKTYIDAFQEVTNEKYHLQSPKENIRSNFEGASEAVSRQKGDQFKGANKEIKAKLLNDIFEKDINSMFSLKKHIEQQGFKVIHRNADREDGYLNIKALDAKKGINLKESVFREHFITQTSSQKKSALNTADRGYVDVGTQYKASNAHHERLKHWHSQRADELRHINSSNRKHYKTLTVQEKQTYLREIKGGSNGRQQTDNRNINDNLKAAGRHLLDAKRNHHGIKRGIRNISDRRAIRTVTTLIHGYRRDKTNSEERLELNKIKQTLDANQLIKSLSATYGVSKNKYTVITASDGSHRIKCGNRKLNVSDFLTQELNLSWKDSKRIIKDEYHRQKNKEIAPTKAEFKKWQPNYITAKKTAWQEQRESERSRLLNQRLELKIKKAAIYQDKTLSKKERNQEISIARMQKVINDMSLKTAFNKEREGIKASYPASLLKQYKIMSTREGIENMSEHRTEHGKIQEHGKAPYLNIKDNKNSYYLKLEQNDGSVKTVWGLGLEDAIKEKNLKVGESASFKNTGKKDVTIKEAILDKDKNVTGYKEFEAERNVWIAEKISHVKKETKEPTTKEKEIKSEIVVIDKSQIDAKLNASRLIYSIPKLKELGIKADDIIKTEKGDKIKFNDKELSITQLTKEALNLKPKEVIEKLKPIYESQINDDNRTLKYKERFMNEQREPLIMKDKKTTENHAYIEHKDKSKVFNVSEPININNVTYKKNKEGHVSYYIDDNKIVTDKGSKVVSHDMNEKAIEVSLRLSAEKFGKSLDIKGTDKFKEQVINVAAKQKMNIEFSDPKMQQALLERKSAFAKGENIIQQAKENRTTQQTRTQDKTTTIER